VSDLRKAIEKAGGIAAVANACGVSPRGVYKWLDRGHLPRTEYTGETRYAEIISEASGGAFTAKWLLEITGPRPTPKPTPAKPTATTA